MYMSIKRGGMSIHSQNLFQERILERKKKKIRLKDEKLTISKNVN